MNSAVLQDLSILRNLFGDRLQENVPLANYTSARVGGPADALLVVHSAEELAGTVGKLWGQQIPFIILGSGANVLVSDRGVRGVVLLNKADALRIDRDGEAVTLWAESGVNLGSLARKIAAKGYAGLEWAAAIPGSVGGAVYGNAGAFGGDMAASLILAEILHQKIGRKEWSNQELAFEYRSSILKRNRQPAVILSAKMKLQPANPEVVKKNMEEINASRKQTQPPGASLGSMFKNPAGDYAGRLIEASGLKGARRGGVEVSQVHGNFFVNDDRATAQDYRDLIEFVIKSVEELQGVRLQLEIELVGDWEDHD
jgi:UDP-N-acetylmuramate dehydrogenase